MWAHNPSMSFFRCGASGDAPGCVYPSSLVNEGDKANKRILDIWVAERVPVGYNLTVTQEEREGWEEGWERGGKGGEGWEGLWEGFGERWGVEPLFWGACEGKGCVGVFVGSGDCVCPPE